MEFLAKSATVSIWTWFLLVRNQYSSPYTPLNHLLLLMEAWNEEVYSCTEQNKVFSRTGYQWLLAIGQQKQGASYSEMSSTNPCLKSSTSWKKKAVTVLQTEKEYK